MFYTKSTMRSKHCKFQSCKVTRKRGDKYCNEHRCIVPFCILMRSERGRFCIKEHTCRIRDCTALACRSYIMGTNCLNCSSYTELQLCNEHKNDDIV